SDIIAIDPATWATPEVHFKSEHVGRELFVHQDSGPTWTTGYYTVTEFIDDFHVRVDKTPTPNAAGEGGWITMAGEPWTAKWNGRLSTSGPGSDILVIPATDNDLFTPEMVGRPFAIMDANGGGGLPPLGQNFVGGSYLITELIDATHLRLNMSPTPD